MADIGDTQEIDIFNPNTFEIYNDNNKNINFNSKIDQFIIYYIQNTPSRKGGSDNNKYNDCLWNCLELSGVSLPKEIATPAKLKKYLQIQRNEKIDYLPTCFLLSTVLRFPLRVRALVRVR